MKARRACFVCILCGVLLAASGCAFRVLEQEQVSETTPSAGQQQPAEAEPAAGQPAVAETTASAAETTSAAEVTPEAAASGESQSAPAQENQVFIPAFSQASAAEGCQQIILNSGMEEDGAWRFVGGKPARYSTEMAHAETRSILAGLAEGRPYHIYSDARQWVTLPSNTVSATLRMWWYPRTEEQTARLIERCTRGNCPTGTLAEGPLPAAQDLQYVLAVRPDWSFEWLLRGKANASQWQPLEFDLSRYAGRTIAIQFGVYNDPRGGLTSMLVDDVELWVCAQ